MKSMHIQNFIHPQTHHEMDIIAEDLALISSFGDRFIQADAVVGAQFYYTNPLLFLLVSDEDVSRHAPLYGDFYLLRVEDWLNIELKYPIIAINDLFSERIGNTKEIFSNFNMEKFIAHHDSDGLYIVGIKVAEQLLE